MTKEQKTTMFIIIGCVSFVALLVLILWLLYRRKEEKENFSSFPLSVGSRCEEVKTLQRCINILIDEVGKKGVKMLPIAEDGIFGAETKNACVALFGEEEVTRKNYKSLLKQCDVKQ